MVSHHYFYELQRFLLEFQYQTATCSKCLVMWQYTSYNTNLRRKVQICKNLPFFVKLTHSKSFNLFDDTARCDLQYKINE